MELCIHPQLDPSPDSMDQHNIVIAGGFLAILMSEAEQSSYKDFSAHLGLEKHHLGVASMHELVLSPV